MATTPKSAIWKWQTRRRYRRMARLPDAVHVEGSLAFLELYLEIADDQRAIWDRFATVMRDGIDAFSAARSYDADEALTAPQAIARLDATAQAGMMVFAKIRAAFDTFYADLSDTQRGRLDELFTAQTEGNNSWWPVGYLHGRHTMCPRGQGAT